MALSIGKNIRKIKIFKSFLKVGLTLPKRISYLLPKKIMTNFKNLCIKLEIILNFSNIYVLKGNKETQKKWENCNKLKNYSAFHGWLLEKQFYAIILINIKKIRITVFWEGGKNYY